MLICSKCYRPNDGEAECLYCGETVFGHIDRQYSVKQWEHWIESLRPNMAHDFMPHEFSEDGEITRGGGTTGSSEYNHLEREKEKKQRRSGWNKIPPNNKRKYK